MANGYKKTLQKKVTNLHLNVLGFPYKVIFEEELINRHNLTATASVWGSEVHVDPSITNLDILSSILHEIIEVMFRKTETKYEHEIISRIEIFLMALIIENPELMELIVETAKKEGGPIKGGFKKRAKALVKGRKGKSGKSM